MTILLAGASGLVGRQVARMLAESSELDVLLRRPLECLPASIKQHACDAADWPGEIRSLKPDVAISCLGTTIRAAGSKLAFSAVDFDLVRDFAAASKGAGTKHLIAISSVGADAASSNFYLSVKGQAEKALGALGFDRLDILRPGLLRGDRQEERPAERIGIMISPLTDMLLHGPLRRYRSIDGSTVARAIANLSIAGGEGQHIHENDAIIALAG